MKPGVMLVLAVAFLSLAMPGIAPAAEARHSGRVMAVDPGAGTVRIQEVVAWTGPETGTVERTIRLTPDTTVQLVRREADVDLPRWAAARRPAPAPRAGCAARPVARSGRRDSR